MVIKAGVLHLDAGAPPEVLEHAGSDVFFCPESSGCARRWSCQIVTHIGEVVPRPRQSLESV